MKFFVPSESIAPTPPPPTVPKIFPALRTLFIPRHTAYSLAVIKDRIYFNAAIKNRCDTVN